MTQQSRLTIIVPQTRDEFLAKTSLLKHLSRIHGSQEIDGLFLEQTTEIVRKTLESYAEQKEIPLRKGTYPDLVRELNASKGNYVFVINKSPSVINYIANQLASPDRRVESTVIY